MHNVTTTIRSVSRTDSACSVSAGFEYYPLQPLR